MRLKKLEILGFKSFADKTVLEFDPGITGIVGPNGCGKSNIADAFRWVLGEQSAKSLRGGKMGDIIFSGAGDRKQLNMAEVTITLTDIQGQLPIEYEEVSVTRRIHRSGDSEYLINRHPVRMKDIADLFLDSGMGKNAFSIFEQGKIDQVIVSTPIERRYIFEEAAGILRFLQRKREALRKLEMTDQNVSRVKDIHQEVEKQIIVLEEQAEKARVYKENKKVLDSLEKSILVAKWENLSKKREDFQKKDDNKKLLIKEANEVLEKYVLNLQMGKVELQECEKAFREHNEAVYKTRNEKELRIREKQSTQERLKESVAKEKRWMIELESMIVKRKNRQIESSNTQKQLKELEKSLDLEEKALKLQREAVNLLETEVNKLRDQQQGSQQELMKLLQAENRIESDLKQNTVRLENNQEKKIQLTERRDYLLEFSKNLEDIHKEKTSLLEKSTDEIEIKKEIFYSLEEKINDLSETIQSKQKEHDLLQQESLDNKARHNALLRLKNELEGFSSGSKKLLQDNSDQKNPLYNKIKGLYEYLIPQPGFENALAAVMRPYAQTLVVKTRTDLNEVLDYAQKNKLKEFSLFCLEDLNEQPIQIVVQEQLTPLLNGVKANPVATHFLNKAYLENDSNSNYENTNDKNIDVWKKNNTFIDRQIVLFNLTQGGNNIFLREAEIKLLDAKIQEDELFLQKIEITLQSLHEKRQHLQAERVELDKVIRREEMKLVEANFALQKVNADLEKNRFELKQIQGDIGFLNTTVENMIMILSDLNKTHIEAKSKVEIVQKSLLALNNDLEMQIPKLRLEQRSLQELETVFHKITDENRRLVHSINVFEVKDLESLQQEQRLEEEIESVRSIQIEIDQKGSLVTKSLEEIDGVLIGVESSCHEVEKNVLHSKKQIENIEEHINKSRMQLRDLETDLNQITIQISHAHSLSQAIEAELEEKYLMNVMQASVAKSELSLDQMEKQARTMRQRIDAAGDINMTSIEEYEKYKIRYQFLNQQIDDLSLSKEELLQIITQLDGESRKIFKETFEKISANFKKNFQILFNGGEADLQFTEIGDVLESGIEIIAKPPGKQMRSINLMSGGEKCLTAMALLFAIFEVKPAPFCILDEIDAPLDDSNVERFVNVVKQFIDRCQFIIITHNKRTMAIADILFGVTMEKKGISKILSMEFSKNNAPKTEMVEV